MYARHTFLFSLHKAFFYNLDKYPNLLINFTINYIENNE